MIGVRPDYDNALSLGVVRANKKIALRVLCVGSSCSFLCSFDSDDLYAAAGTFSTMTH